MKKEFAKTQRKKKEYVRRKRKKKGEIPEQVPLLPKLRTSEDSAFDSLEQKLILGKITEDELFQERVNLRTELDRKNLLFSVVSCLNMTKS